MWSAYRLTFLARLGGMRQKMMDIESLQPRGVVSVLTFQQIGRARDFFFGFWATFLRNALPVRKSSETWVLPLARFWVAAW